MAQSAKALVKEREPLHLAFISMNIKLFLINV